MATDTSVFVIHVRPRDPDPAKDREGRAVLGALREFGIRGVEAVRAERLYELRGALGRAEAERVAREALADPVAEVFEVVESGTGTGTGTNGELVLTVMRRPGVMDPVLMSARKALGDMGLGELVTGVRTARRYRLRGRLTDAERKTAERKVIANPVIEEVLEGAVSLPPEPAPRPARAARVEVPLDALERFNREGGLALSAVELQAIAAHYRDVERRDPTDAELETIAQTWSEHCKHKTLAGAVRYEGPLGSWQDDGTASGEKIYKNLLKETIFRATNELDRDWCLSVFSDNAGVVAFDERLGVCMKVETHNHPSALEPYGGAGTGVGGVVRDILGTGLGARPIANTDVFCFGPPDLDPARVPPGALHPRQVLRGVVAGVRDYGNRLGIPTVSGAVLFDERYVGNPLVYCGTVGLIPRERIDKAPRAGDAIVVAGGRTGRDGIHGATFSSAELDEASERTSSGAVQIGNPIEEKRLLDVLLAARDRGLYRAVTDCGAGGLSSAVGEMGAELGAAVALERVPLKYEGLTPAEIWISEAQERMVLAVPPERLRELLKLFAAEDVEATEIGRFTGDGRLRLTHGDVAVGDLDVRFLHEGLPRVERRARYEPPGLADARPATASDLEPREPGGRFDDDVLAILRSWNVCSKEWIIRQYDHEVQGTSAVKPLVGARDDGPSDAAVLAPVHGSRRGIAISCGVNPRYGDIDPWRMAAAAVDEAIRNAVATGADPDRCAILDNFSWGDCSLPDRLGAIALAAEGAAWAATALGAPFISGKDSLNNEYQTAAGRIAIPGTLLVSCLAIHPDVGRAATMDLKRAGNRLYLVGPATAEELGGSHFHLVRGLSGGQVPRLHAEAARATFRTLHHAIHAGLVRACHDLSEGGLAVAAAEMALAGGLGAALGLPPGVPAAVQLFSESLSRFLVEVEPARCADFERALGTMPCIDIGIVTSVDRLTICDAGGQALVDIAIALLRKAFREPLPQILGDSPRSGIDTL